MSSQVYQYALEVAYQIASSDLAIATSGGVGISESYSLEIVGAAPDISLSVSESANASESLSVYYTGVLPPIFVSDTIHAIDSLTFIETTPVPAAPAVSGTINGNPIENFVRSLRRVGHLCNPGQHATLIMSPDWPHGSNPGKQVFLYENGYQVMKGFTIRSVRSRPSYEWVIEVDDTYTLVVSTFLDVPEATTAGHDTSYWCNYILEKCGANFNIYGSPAPVPAGIQIGLRPASEALKDILAYASWYVWPDKNGTLQIGEIHRNISGRTVTEYVKFEHDLSDDMTRNVIKVFGVGKIFASASVATPGIVPDRIAVVGSPLIMSNAEAQRVADYMVGEIGGLTEIIRGQIPGNPKIKIGNVVTLTHSIDGVPYSVTDTVSSLESNYDDSGYTMEITVGERCPRIAGFSQKIPWTYAGLNGNGVYYSRDKGVTWAAMNSGLTTGTKVASRVAGDSYGKALAIINNSLFYETGTNWQSVTLPSPGGTAKAVGSLGGMDSFAVLTGSRVFFSIPSSGSEPPDDPTVSSGSISGWTSVPITTVDLTSGSTLYGYGWDMYTKSGTAYVNATTSSGSGIPSSGSGGGGAGTNGWNGGTPSSSVFGSRVTASSVTNPPTTTYGTTTATINGLTDIVLDDSISGSGGTWLPGSVEVAIHLETLLSEYGDGYCCTATRIIGSLSVTGTSYAQVGMKSSNGTTDYYGAGTGQAIPSNVGLSSNVVGCAPGDTVGFNIRMPGIDYDFNWWKDGFIAVILYSRTDLDLGGTVHAVLSIDEIEVEYDDGGWGIFYPSSGSVTSGSYNLYTVSQNGAILVSDIPVGANINDRLYVSDDGEVVLYNTNGRLLISNDFGGTWHSAYPSSAPTKVAAVTRAQTTSTPLITSGSYNTVIGAISSGSTETLYQQAVETSGGWSPTSGSVPSNFVVTDAIWSSLSTQGVLVGGGSAATKIYRYDPAEPPFASPVASDSGIPSESASDVLDLEFGE